MKIFTPQTIKIGLYVLTSLLFVIAFAISDLTTLRWVFLCCAIVFGSIGFSALWQMLKKDDTRP